MATIKTDLICNLNQPVNVTYLHGNLFSQDNAGNTINVFVMDNGEPATIGGTVSANVIRSDGQTVAVSGAIEGNKAYVILPQACYAVPGVVHIIIKLTQSTTVTTIAAVVANVYMSTTDAVIDPGTVIPSIQALMALIEEAVDSIPTDYTGLLHTIAADYSSSKTYKVGDYAWESGVLKRCIVPITAAETYTAAHWTNAVIGDDLTNLKSALDIINNADYVEVPFEIDGIKYINYVNGTLGPDDPPPGYNTSSHTDYIDVSNFKEIKYKRWGGTSTGTIVAGMAFYAADKTYISGIPSLNGQAADGYVFYETAVPSNAKYARFTTRTDTTTYGQFELYGKSEIAKKLSELENDIALLSDSIKQDGADYTIESGGYISGANGNIVASENWSHTSYIDVSSATKIRYTRSTHTISTPAVGIAFYDESKAFISGVIGVGDCLAQHMNALTDVPVPNNARYVRLSVFNSESSSFSVKLCNAITDLQDEMAVAEGKFVYHPSVAQSKKYIADDGTLTTSSIQCITNPMPVKYGRMYRITMTNADSYNMRINGLNGNATYLYDSSTYIKKIYATFSPASNATSVFEFIVNDKRIKNVVISLRLQTTNVSFEDIGAYNDDGLNLHEMPSLVNIIGEVKRARQFTDIEWTPLANLPRFDQITNDAYVSNGRMADQYTAGKTYKGFPYSSGNISEMRKYGYSYGHIGYDAPISAFLTSLFFSNSFLYLKSPGTETNVQATAYGATCDVLACYAMGLGEWVGSDSFVTLVNNGTVVKITDVDTMNGALIEIGDLIWLRAVHIAVITDIVRDASGNIEYIEVSEATTKSIQNTNIIGGSEGGLCRRFAWNVTEFKKRFEGYAVYRYPAIYTKGYSQNPYVQVGAEVAPINLYNNMPIIPFMGEGFVYKTGYIENNTLLSQTDRYAKVAVFKDGELFNTYDYAAVLAVPFVDAGSYEAFLYNSSDGTVANMTERSLKCHWIVS